MSKQIRLAIDAMGGDYAPLEIVRGGLLAARELNVKVFLVGKAAEIQAILDQEGSHPNIEIIDAPEDIPMEEKNPARAVRKYLNSSIVIANKLVSDGIADAVIAAGNTGAATAASLFGLKRIEGFERPCICTLIPTISGVMFLIDGGSNIEASAENIFQNALIGNILAKAYLKIPEPRIGLLNVGSEPGKGNELYKKTYELLEAHKGFNFIGNVEGKIIIDASCDVVVCDGFTGNIHLKSLEGGLKMMALAVQNEIKGGNPLALLGGFFLKISGVFDRIKAHFHPNSFGGALLGGLNHISIISHGSSNAEAIKNACKQAKLYAEIDVCNEVRKALLP
jgi:glycerol-3-phosphate acyltransferase PlsX